MSQITINRSERRKPTSRTNRRIQRTNWVRPGFLLLVFATALAVLSPIQTSSAADTADAPIDVVFVLDNSGSMKASDPSFLTRRAVSNFADALALNAGVEGRIAIILFDGRVRVAQPLTPVGSITSNGDLARALSSLDYSGQRTNSTAGIERALYELHENGRPHARQAIVFLSDGKIDTGNARGDATVARWLRDDLASESAASGVRIFGIAFTDDADYQLMQALAQRTDARYYRAFEASELASVIDDVLAKIDDAAGDQMAGGAVAQVDLPATPPAAPSLPDVAAAPVEDTQGFGLLGWIPVVLFLGGASLFIGFRQRKIGRDLRGRSALKGAAHQSKSPAPDVPPGQLLDTSGQLGEMSGVIALDPDRTTIGRDPHNDVTLDHDAVSSEHAVIEVHDGRYWLQNLRATNGTCLGERKLGPDERVALKGGDHIRFADVELMFAVAGYVPVGGTVFLSSSQAASQHQSDAISQRSEATVYTEATGATEVDFERVDPFEDVEPNDAPHPIFPDDSNELISQTESTQENAFTEQGEPLRSATFLGHDAQHGADSQDALDAPGAAKPILTEVFEQGPQGESPTMALLPDPPPEPKTEFAGPPIALVPEEPPAFPASIPTSLLAPVPTTATLELETAPLREALEFHLARVSELSADFTRFVDQAFDEELRSALPVAARDLLKASLESGRIEQSEYTYERVRYVTCAVPGAMDDARKLFVDCFGGFTRLLAEELQSEPFVADRCETLVVLSFGFDGTPWVSLSIVPEDGQEPQIDLLTYEFLTDEERREIEPSPGPEVSQSGLA